MIKTGNFLIFLFLPLLLSASLKVEIKTSKRLVKTGEPVMIQVEINGNERITQVLPPVSDNFSISSIGTSSNISIINGVTTNSFSYNFYLFPKAAGKIEVSPFKIRSASGETLSEAFFIEAVNGNLPQNQVSQAQIDSQAEDIFYRIIPSGKEFYPNQPVLLRYVVYSRINFRNPQLLSEPDFSSVLTDSFENTGSRSKVTISGVEYWEIELGRRIVYPVEPGKITLGSSGLQVGTITRNRRQNIFGNSLFDDLDRFFDDDFFSPWVTETPLRIDSLPIELTVNPFPQEKPDNFSNLCGEFLVEAELDRLEANAGDAVNLTVTIKGNGNLKGFKLNPEFGEEFQVFDTREKLETAMIDGTPVSSLKYETVLIPRKTGSITIPPVTLCFFNPQDRQYHSVSTGKLYLNVKGTIVQTPLLSSSTSEKKAEPGSIDLLGQDIAYIRETCSSENIVVIWSKYFYLLLLFLLLLPVFSFAAFSFHSRFSGNTLWRLQHSAGSRSLKKLDALQKDPSADSKKRASMAGEIFVQYFKDRFRFHVWAGNDEFRKLLSGCKIPDETAEKAVSVYDRIILWSYTPGNTETENTLLSEIRSVIIELDRRKL